MVRPIRLQLYSGRSPGDVHAGRYLPEYGKLPASPVAQGRGVYRSPFHHDWKRRLANSLHFLLHVFDRKNQLASSAAQAVDASSLIPRPHVSIPLKGSGLRMSTFGGVGHDIRQALQSGKVIGKGQERYGWHEPPG